MYLQKRKKRLSKNLLSSHLPSTAHHHTYTNIDGLDHQILLEVDFLVNAGESGYARSAIENFRQRVFRTAAGTELLDSMYLKGEENP